MIKRRHIPLETKQAVIADIDRGDNRTTIKKKYHFKNYSNINRILEQRATLQSMMNTQTQNAIDDDQEFSDTDEMQSASEESDNTTNQHIATVAMKGHLEKIKLGMRLLKEVSDTFSQKIQDTLEELENAEEILTEIEESIDEVDNGEEVEEESDNSDDENSSEVSKESESSDVVAAQVVSSFEKQILKQ